MFPLKFLQRSVLWLLRSRPVSWLMEVPPGNFLQGRRAARRSSFGRMRRCFGRAS